MALGLVSKAASPSGGGDLSDIWNGRNATRGPTDSLRNNSKLNIDYVPLAKKAAIVRIDLNRQRRQNKGMQMAPELSADLTTIGFDADDTLWHNERFYRLTQGRFQALLADYADPGHLAERLLAAERRNLGHYGFGIKGFTLSMIETAIEVTEDRVPAAVLGDLLACGREMLSHPIELVPHARDAVEGLAGAFKLVLITKGDLLDQERKLAQSGLGELFDGVEIVSDKTAPRYAEIFARHGDGAPRAMMIGNSMNSDVIPALVAGAWGVCVPQGIAWAIEHAEPPEDAPRFRELTDLSQLPGLVAEICGR